MRIGKLDNATLDALILSKCQPHRKESLCAPAVGQDCTSLDLFGDLLVTSCDPITSAHWTHLGALSVHVNCNDAAAAGAEPVGLLVTLLMPPSGTEAQIDRIADDLLSAAADVHVDVLGGHTEVTESVTRPITCTTVLARANRSNRLIGAKRNDDLVLTKWAGLEGSMLAATDFPQLLTALPKETLETCRGFGRYLSVVPESRIAMENGAHAMHDVTEGGVLGAAWELASLSGLGAVIDRTAIPVRPETAAICAALQLDAARFISSGAMLIACADGASLCKALQQHDIPAAVIGRVTPQDFLLADGTPFLPSEADELYKIFAMA